MSTDWISQFKREANESANKLIEPEEIVKVQGTSFIDHKCSFCKAKIPAGQGLIRVTQVIRTPYSENPIYKSIYYCNQDCKDKKKLIKSKESIPEGFEMVNI